MRRIAVVGSGITGLAAAWRLADRAQVTLFEADARFGGHAHTVDLTLDGIRHGVDTGFLVFNHRTYPQLVRLFETLGVNTTASDMSFSVQMRGGSGAAPGHDLEWSGSDLNSVFAQRSNLLRPRFWRMLRDLMRFNRLCTALAQQGTDAELQEDIGSFLDRHGFGDAFRAWYFLPMIGCIWSCPTAQMLRFPVGTMIRFCHNHGLIQVRDRPQWYTVTGGSKHYVQAMLARIPDARASTPVRGVRRDTHGPLPVHVRTDHGVERFDHIVFASHSDQTLALLDDATDGERAVLGAIRYHANRAVLHTDEAMLPRRRRAWAAWNYERAADETSEGAGVCLHYLINRLQPLPWERPVVVSLNPAREPEAKHVHGEWSYAHPVFDGDAIRAQQRLPALQGQKHSWFAGAWTRYGFHEDGLMSANAAVDDLLARIDRGADDTRAVRVAA